jgi:hypothetical protein
MLLHHRGQVVLAAARIHVLIDGGVGDQAKPVQPPPSPRWYWTRCGLDQVIAVFYGLGFCSHLCAWNAAFMSSSGLKAT